MAEQMYADPDSILWKETAENALFRLRRIDELCGEALKLVGEPAAWLLAEKIRKAQREWPDGFVSAEPTTPAGPGV